MNPDEDIKILNKQLSYLNDKLMKEYKDIMNNWASHATGSSSVGPSSPVSNSPRLKSPPISIFEPPSTTNPCAEIHLDLPLTMASNITPRPQSKIKMIATSHSSRDNTHTPEIFALSMDDRIFQYDAENASWTELPPIPDL